jgi:catechol 2,3-dioxygenase-like lactoylglutathione lyase family enzyme
MQSETSATALPNPDHVGVVVKDTDKTVEFLSSIGVGGPWKTFDFVQDKDILLAGEPFRLKIAFAKVGTTAFELLQPVEGNSVWAQFLKTNGEGIHHVAFSVANFDEWVSRVQSQGGRMITGGRALMKEEEDRITVVGSPEGNRWCYLDTKPGGMIIEFMDNLMGLAPVS